MAILKVLHFPDERLRMKGVTIEEIDSEIASLAENMLESMYLEGWIWLAATQVNIQKRIVVIDLSENKDDPLILINPKISKLEGIKIFVQTNIIYMVLSLSLIHICRCRRAI